MNSFARVARVSLAALALCSALPLVQAQKRAGSNPRLAKAAELYAESVDADEIRGVVLLVAQRGRTVLHKAYGFRDADDELPMRKDTLFRLASNTKALVSMSVLMLAERGKLDVQAPLGRYLPAFANDKCGAITIHHLLTHTSGLRIPTLFVRPLMKKSEAHPNAPTLQLEVDRFAAIGPEVKPGTSYRYSNPGYNTLGALVEKVSGMPLAEFLRRRIYKPLGMKDSCNHESVADQARMSAVFRKKDEYSWRVSWKPGDPATVPFVRASGGGIGTAADYARFLQAWIDDRKPDKLRRKGAGPRMLRPESVRAAAKPHSAAVYDAETRDKRKSFYGYGWAVGKNGVLTHSGSDGTAAWIDLEREILGVVFTQSTPRDGALFRRFRAAVTRALAR